jgi:hypothetical protein
MLQEDRFVGLPGLEDGALFDTFMQEVRSIRNSCMQLKEKQKPLDSKQSVKPKNERRGRVTPQNVPEQQTSELTDTEYDALVAELEQASSIKIPGNIVQAALVARHDQRMFNQVLCKLILDFSLIGIAITNQQCIEVLEQRLKEEVNTELARGNAKTTCAPQQSKLPQLPLARTLGNTASAVQRPQLIAGIPADCVYDAMQNKDNSQIDSILARLLNQPAFAQCKDVGRLRSDLLTAVKIAQEEIDLYNDQPC